MIKSVPKGQLWFVSVGIAGLIIIGALTWYRLYVFAPGQEVQIVQASINNSSFNLEVADTPELRSKGLAGKPGLDENEGMLFIFERPGTECFWMKDVGFSIDILWFDEDRTLIHKLPGISPDTYPDRFCPPEPAKYVVELRNGVSEDKSFELGDKLKIINR